MAKNELSEQAKFKLWVRFLDGGVKTFYSYPLHEDRGTAPAELKALVTGKFLGHVGVAYLYDNQSGQALEEYLSMANVRTWRTTENLIQSTTTP